MKVVDQNGKVYIENEDSNIIMEYYTKNKASKRNENIFLTIVK